MVSDKGLILTTSKCESFKTCVVGVMLSDFLNEMTLVFRSRDAEHAILKHASSDADGRPRTVQSSIWTTDGNSWIYRAFHGRIWTLDHCICQDVDGFRRLDGETVCLMDGSGRQILILT